MNARWENYLQTGFLPLEPHPQQIIQPIPSQQPAAQPPVRRGGCCGRK